ncbi:MAG TPA: phage tail tape measure protein [Planctomycetaceae bacterium]|nr:phage tail tape measure protein [Planctomycetaceae bacterium]
MTARGIRAGNAYVTIDSDLNPLQKKLKQISDRFKALGSRISGIGRSVANFGAITSGIGASVTAPILAASKAFQVFGDNIQKTSVRTGLTADQLTSLGFAAEQSGSSLDQLAQAIFRSNRRIANAATETGPAVRALKELGLSARNLSRLDTESRFLALADALSKVQNEFRANQLGFEIFGDNFRQLQPLLAEGADGIRKLQQEARDLGVTIDGLDISNAAALGDAFNRVTRTFKAAVINVGAAVAEPLIRAANAASQVVAVVSNWIKANRTVVLQVAAIGAAIAAIGSIVTTVGIGLIGAGLAISSIGTIITTSLAAATAVVGGLTAAIAAVATPVGLVGTAILGLGAYVTAVALSSTGSIQELTSSFTSLGSTATTAWSGIVAAVSTGDLQTAGQIAFTALKVGWLTVTNTIKQVWANVSDFFVNTWLNAVENIVQIGANIYFGVSRQFDLLSTSLIGAFDTAFVYIRGAIDQIQTAIAKAIVKAQQFFGLFSESQSLEIQQSLDADLERRASDRASGLERRSQNRSAGLAQRDQERRDTAQHFSEIVAEDFQRRQSQVDNSGLTDAQKRLEELKLKLSTQASEAQEKAAKAQTSNELIQRAEGARLGAVDALNSSAGSVGTFVSGVAGQIAGGGTSPLETLGQQQVDLLSNIAGQIQQGNRQGVLQ